MFEIDFELDDPDFQLLQKAATSKRLTLLNAMARFIVKIALAMRRQPTIEEQMQKVWGDRQEPV